MGGLPSPEDVRQLLGPPKQTALPFNNVNQAVRSLIFALVPGERRVVGPSTLVVKLLTVLGEQRSIGVCVEMDGLIALWRSAEETTRGLGIAGLGPGSFKAADLGTGAGDRYYEPRGRMDRPPRRTGRADLPPPSSNRKVEGVIAPPNPYPLSDDEFEITSRNNLTRLSAAREEKVAC
ncbi:unnamed protein product [Clonostachys chloroleuca]|uniref:Uncharacterized protein n=2 Tax=Clonostachys chloroleuca TaxID=1926264 RepID=A0AA35LR25_9HYPO|nr:unnamed protein product [Clonostachys chloroleuca]